MGLFKNVKSLELAWSIREQSLFEVIGWRGGVILVKFCPSPLTSVPGKFAAPPQSVCTEILPFPPRHFMLIAVLKVATTKCLFEGVALKSSPPQSHTYTPDRFYTLDRWRRRREGMNCPQQTAYFAKRMHKYTFSFWTIHVSHCVITSQINFMVGQTENIGQMHVHG